jgi:hypothetical protein
LKGFAWQVVPHFRPHFSNELSLIKLIAFDQLGARPSFRSLKLIQKLVQLSKVHWAKNIQHRIAQHLLQSHLEQTVSVQSTHVGHTQVKQGIRKLCPMPFCTSPPGSFFLHVDGICLFSYIEFAQLDYCTKKEACKV